MYIYNECVKNDAENFSCKFTSMFLSAQIVLLIFHSF